VVTAQPPLHSQVLAAAELDGMEVFLPKEVTNMMS
jgi:hypothetical protein